MANVSELLQKILHREYVFCSSCLKAFDEDRIDFDDEVLLLENKAQKHKKLSEIFACVVGDAITEDLSTFQSICLQCATSAVNAYKFIKEVKRNMKYLNNVVENLNYCFEDVHHNLDSCDTLFLTVNQDFSPRDQYYDNMGPIQSKSEAFDVFCSIAKLKKSKVEITLTKLTKQEEIKMTKTVTGSNKHKKSSARIRTKDMVYNGDLSDLKCVECSKVFFSVPNLRCHYLRVHAPKDFKCPECPKSYGTLSFLRSHEAESHSAGGMVCTECGKGFTNMHTLKSHERNHYLKIVCQECGRVYKNQNTFKKHLDNNVCQTTVRHSPVDAKFTCDYCGKKYTQKISLRVHIQYEHGNYKYHECKWCKKKFWCQSRLKAHIVKHTKEKKFICTICSGKFVTKESLLYHTRIHTGERPYPCPFCDSKFLSASRRQAHIRNQHADPTVECDICHSKFKSIHYLIKHKKIHELQKNITDIVKTETNSEQRMILGANLTENMNMKTYEGNTEKVIYSIIEGDPKVYKIEIDPNDMEKSDLIHYVDNNNDTSPSVNNSNDTIYFEVSEECSIKVSENVEV